jgi:hypothetical protein
MGPISPTTAFLPLITNRNPPYGATAAGDIQLMEALNDLSAEFDCRIIIDSHLEWSFDSRHRKGASSSDEIIYLIVGPGQNPSDLTALMALEVSQQLLLSDCFQISIDQTHLFLALRMAKVELEKWKAGCVKPFHRMDMPDSTEDEIIGMLKDVHDASEIKECSIGIDDSALAEHCLNAFRHYLNEPVFIEDVSGGARRTASTDEWIPDVINCRKGASRNHHLLATPSADHTRLLFSENEGVLMLRIGQIRSGTLRKTDKIPLPNDAAALCRGIATARIITGNWENQPQAASQKETDELQMAVRYYRPDLTSNIGEVHAERFAGLSNTVTKAHIFQESRIR